MVTRFFTARHAAIIATGTVLAPLTPPAGGDIRGNPRYLVGVRIQGGADCQRVQINSPDWGARRLEMPPVGVGGAVAGLRTAWLEHPQLVNVNQIVNMLATQNSGGPQLTTFDLLYYEGEMPTSFLNTVAEVHDMFVTGVASPGFMPSVPSASQRMEQAAGTNWSPIALAGNVPTVGNVQITFPEADGQGPQAPLNQDVLQQQTWTEVAPLQTVNNGDTVDVSVEDVGGGTFSVFIRFVKHKNGSVPMTRFTPMYGVIA